MSNKKQKGKSSRRNAFYYDQSQKKWRLPKKIFINGTCHQYGKPITRYIRWIEGEKLEQEDLIRVYEWCIKNNFIYLQMKADYDENWSDDPKEFSKKYGVSMRLGYAIFSLFKNKNKSNQFYDLDQYLKKYCD